MKPRLLNVGCGEHFHREWTNIDLASSSPGVQQHNILEGLPFDDDSFDACYQSHVLEHLECEDAELSVAR